MKKIRVGVLAPDPGGAVSFYRVMGPFNALERASDKIEIVAITKACWSDFTKIDLLFMHRCTTDSEVDVLSMAKIGGIPVWIDYDDNLLAVPQDSPAYNAYENGDKVRNNLKKILAFADCVTCTTESLKKTLTDLYEREIIVLPNALNDSFVKRHLTRPTKTFVWRGSKTHVNDLIENREMVASLVAKYPDYTWCFIGQYPWMFSEIIPKDQLLYIEGSDPYKYHQILRKMAPEFMIVPLVDSEFNRAKSNIAWIEGTWAGAKVFASNLPEFNVPGCGIPSLGIDPDMEKSFSYIEENLLLSNVNSLRLQIIENLMERK